MLRSHVLISILGSFLVLGGAARAQVVDPPDNFQRDPVLSSVHIGLGWATLASAMATGILDPHRAGLATHETLGWTTAALAAATMVFGIAAHWGEVGPGFGWDANNIHSLLGAAGGTLMMVAPLVAPPELHKALGELGTLAMGIAVVWKIVY